MTENQPDNDSGKDPVASNTGKESDENKPCPFCGSKKDAPGPGKGLELTCACIRNDFNTGMGYVSSFRWNSAVAWSRIATLQARNAELEKHNATLTGERFSDRNHTALQSRIADLEKRNKELLDDLSELSDINVAQNKIKNERIKDLESKLKTAEDKLAAYREGWARSLCEWDKKVNGAVMKEGSYHEAVDAEAARIMKEKEGVNGTK